MLTAFSIDPFSILLDHNDANERIYQTSKKGYNISEIVFGKMARPYNERSLKIYMHPMPKFFFYFDFLFFLSCC